MNYPHEKRAFLLAAGRAGHSWRTKEAFGPSFGMVNAMVRPVAALGRAITSPFRAVGNAASSFGNFMTNRVAPKLAPVFFGPGAGRAVGPMSLQTPNAAIQSTARATRVPRSAAARAEVELAQRNGTPGLTPSGAVPPAGAPAPTPTAPTPTNSFGHLAWNAVRGGLGFGAQENSTGTAKAVAGLAGVGMIGAPLAAGALGHGGNAQNPYQQQLGMQVTAGVYTVKTAFNPEKVRAGVDLASYGALAAPLVAKLFAPKFYESHQGLMHGLDLAGLAGLTGTGVYGVATERKKLPDALDVAGLGLMGMALGRRLSGH